MRICRYDDGKIGLVAGDFIFDVSAVSDSFQQPRWPKIFYDPLIACLPDARSTLLQIAAAATPIPIKAVTLLSPVATPSRIIALPTSYRAHANEAKSDPVLAQHLTSQSSEPQTFIKASPSLVGAGEGVALRFLSKRTDPELELAIVIGRPCDSVEENDAMSFVAGYTIALDMSLRDAGPPSGRKSIDSYSVLGPWLVTADELSDASNLQMTLTVNGETRQNAPTSDLIFTLPQIVAHCSRYFHLQPGDVIMTGTPAGVAPVKEGDVMVAKIQGIGEMTVAVRAYRSPANCHSG